MFTITGLSGKNNTEYSISMQGDVLIIDLAAPVRDATFNGAAWMALDPDYQPAINVIVGALQCR